jgi:predicted kinase
MSKKTKKIIFLKGLPASGKSTFAKQLVKDNPSKYKRINKDDIRAMLDGSHWSKLNEHMVVLTRDLLVNTALIGGFTPIVDDTNFEPKHLEAIKKIADAHNAEIEEHFFDTPVMECIERDHQRPNPVGGKVILGMYNKYLKPEAPEWSEDKMNAYIFDIDGTLAKMNGRSPYDYSKVGNDVPNHSITMIARLLKQSGLPIYIMSGRPETCREETEKWLRDNSVPFELLFMRAEGDKRKDSIVKEELYRMKLEPFCNVLAVFDDRNQVVDMWRSLGLTCLHVDYGNC